MKDDECWQWAPNKKSCERKKSHLAGHVEKNSTKVRDDVQQDCFFPVRPIILMICDVRNCSFSRRSVTALLLFSGQNYKDILLPNFYPSPHIALKLRPKTSINSLQGE